ncbi:MAG: hypothetical protein IJZ89_08980 [Clostridia bacterium]|nr:hypothetical protein [Clostridia bacterium]
MKKSKITKLMSLLLCTVMLFSTIISSSALTLQTFAGTIISEMDIDLSGIEVKIYSSDPVYDEEGNISYYAETYERSVYTDADGVFEFVKPTAYCSYTVNVETLPAGYGISKHTQFIVPSRTADSIDIAPIATADTELEGDNIVVTFSDADGKTLYTDYEIVPDTAETVSAGNMQSITATEAVMTYSALKALDSYTYSGMIVAKGNSYKYSEEYDLSDFSILTKAELLYSVNKISKNEMYNIYYDYLNDPEIEISCGTGIYQNLIDYCSSSECTDNSLKSKVLLNSNLDTTALSDYSGYVDGSYGSTAFKVYYEKASDFSLANSMMLYINDLYTFFVDNYGFMHPIPTDSNNGYEFYLDSSCTALGVTVPTGNSNYRIKSKINIQRKSSSDITEYEGTIAHEFMHAIMLAYGITEEWFHEQCGEMTEWTYTGNSFTYESLQNIQYYLDRCNLSMNASLTTNNLERAFYYGAMLFPLYIYENFGGWNCLKNIFLNYYSNYPSNAEYSLFDAISGTYGTIPIEFNYANAFGGMAASNYNPIIGYNLAPSDGSWGRPQINNLYLANVVTGTLSPMSYSYHTYSSSSIYSANFTVDVTSSNDRIMVYGILGSTNSNIISKTQVMSVTRAVFPVENFGDSNSDFFTLLPINTYCDSNNVSYSISVCY